MGVSARAAAVALASLPAMSPIRLRAIHEALGFERGWHHLLEGRLVQHGRLARCLGTEPAVTQAELAAAAQRLEPSALLDAHRRAGVEVLVLGDERYPSALAVDPEPPAVLFARGDIDVVAGRRVAIIGTRRCTRSGRDTARELGFGLASEGVRVVSGLALGIDGAAHEGALKAVDQGPAPVVGVVGSGLDVVYPPRHAQLWDAVATRGVLLSEWPLGTRSLPWRFPARNRIIAALAEVVLVVESHAAGGALNTVEAAVRRDREVLVVPGSVRSPASDGTNALLFDGAGPARDTADVLVALGFVVAPPAQLRLDDGEGSGAPISGRGAPSSTGDLGSAPLVPSALAPSDLEVLDHLAGEARTLDQLAVSTGRALSDLSVTLLRFEQHGWVARSGTWFERIGP
jgi:DNA processing protein